MSSATILIIDGHGSCALCAANILMSEGLSVIVAGDLEKARYMMAINRPELILADCSTVVDPLVLVEEIHSLDFPGQVIAVVAEPDFSLTMDWVAGGVFNVMSKPLDKGRLRRLVKAVLDNHEMFKALMSRPEEEPASGPVRSLAAFYRGLSGRLDPVDLKEYVVDGVKRLTGARQVELDFACDLTWPPFCLESHASMARVEAAAGGRPQDKTSGSTVDPPHGWSHELSFNGVNFGSISLYFTESGGLSEANRKIVPEIIAAVSAALSSVDKYQGAVNLAARDSLTGLYNRRIFTEVLKREFAQARRHQFNLSLLSLDLDHFKSVNDNFGHQIGDQVLKSVAEVINKVARATDLPARVGGEEFAIILPHTSQEQAHVMAQRLKNILAESVFNFSGVLFRQTVSQGLVGLEHFLVKSAEDMVYWADQALYLAKREGRDTICTASDLPITPVIKDGPYAFQ